MNTRTRTSLGLGLTAVLAASVTLGVRSTAPIQAQDQREAFIDRYLEVADQIDASLAERLRSMCQQDPVTFESTLRRLGPMLSGLADLQIEDPDLYQRKIEELHMEATVGAMAIEFNRLAHSGGVDHQLQREAMRAQLAALVRMQLQTSLVNRELFVNRLAEHLEQLQAEIEMDRASIDVLTQERVNELTGS